MKELMVSVMVVVVLVIGCFEVHGIDASSAPPPTNTPPCRFALNYSVEDLSNSTKFEEFLYSVMYWEGQFHQDGVGYNAEYGLTYDGHGINHTTGELAEGMLHSFSAPSKESIHVALLALAVAGNPYALRFISASSPAGSNGTQIALDILTTKMNSYEKWNSLYPGYAGFLPWYQINETGLFPANGWNNQVPALDNGELVWALRATALVLNNVGETELASRYLNYFYMMANNSIMVFYAGDGKIRSVTTIADMYATPTPSNYQSQCECYLDDPYEGELFAFLMDLYAPWTNATEREQIWTFKQALLQPVNYTHTSQNVTVQRGWWFSSHEQWKYMELPYTDIPINKQVFINGEIARTWNSYIMQYPGLFASVNYVSTNDSIPFYLSATGIQEIAFQPSQSNYVITPYASFPSWLVDPVVGAAWYLNMLQGPSMQGPYGSTEGISVDGSKISPVLTWDSKITTVLAMLGGITDYTRTALQLDGKYDRFYSIVQTQWDLKFPELSGSWLELQLPQTPIPWNLTDFPTCTA